MTRPTPAALAQARSSLPVRRVASASFAATPPVFANMLHTAAGNKPAAPNAAATTRTSRPRGLNAPTFHSTMQPAVGADHATMVPGTGSETPMSRAEIVANAEQFMNVPYVWGGASAQGLDCSAFISKAWGVSRHTTDNLASIARPITKDELRAGDALNLTTGRDPGGTGHVRLFDSWANPEHTRMNVYEQTPPRSVHHAIKWDPAYTPMRRNNVIDA